MYDEIDEYSYLDSPEFKQYTELVYKAIAQAKGRISWGDIKRWLKDKFNITFHCDAMDALIAQARIEEVGIRHYRAAEYRPIKIYTAKEKQAYWNSGPTLYAPARPGS